MPGSYSPTPVTPPAQVSSASTVMLRVTLLVLLCSTIVLGDKGKKGWRFEVETKEAALQQAQEDGVGFSKDGKEVRFGLRILAL